MSITEERKKVVDFSDPYAQSGLSLLINNDSPAMEWTDLNQEGMVIAVKSGTTGAILAQEALPKAEILSFDEVAACVLEVSQGKADAFIYDILTIFESQKKYADSTRINASNIPGSQSPWGAALKKGNQELLGQVNAFIISFRKDGGYDALAETYLGEIKALFDETGVPFFFDL